LVWPTRTDPLAEADLVTPNVVQPSPSEENANNSIQSTKHNLTVDMWIR
jgi:hypothetical protein